MGKKGGGNLKAERGKRRKKRSSWLYILIQKTTTHMYVYITKAIENHVCRRKKAKERETVARACYY